MVRMKAGESLKNYVNYFQSQMALVYNCNKDVVVAAFIMVASHPLVLQHLVKNDISKMRDILVQTKKYMQIKEATRGATNRPL